MKKLFLLSTVFVVSALLSMMPVMAHVHPTVPANECANGAGAGNTASPQNGANGNTPLPGLILNNNPSAVDGSEVGPGVASATARCANF